MDPNIKQVFIDVHKWVRETQHIATPEEVNMLKESTLRIRSYALGGFLVGAGGAWVGIKRAFPMLRGWNVLLPSTCCGMLGAFGGITSAGPACLKQLLALPDSAMAEQARKIVINRRAFASQPNYIQAFPPGALQKLREENQLAHASDAKRPAGGVENVQARGGSGVPRPADREGQDSGETPSQRRERIIRTTMSARAEQRRQAAAGKGEAAVQERIKHSQEEPRHIDRRTTGGRRLLPWEEREMFPGPRRARPVGDVGVDAEHASHRYAAATRAVAAAPDSGALAGMPRNPKPRHLDVHASEYGAPKLNAYGDPL